MWIYLTPIISAATGMEEETQTCKTACGRCLLFAQQLSSYQVISRWSGLSSILSSAQVAF